MIFKKVFYFIPCCSPITVELHGQPCHLLDSHPFFSSVTLGSQVPGDLISCDQKSKLVYPFYVDYHFQHDNLSPQCRKKFADLFTFQSLTFCCSQITTNKKGQISSVGMWSFFEDNQRDDSINYQLPASFSMLYDKLVLLYGTPTEIKGATVSDSLFIRETAMPRTISWECNEINLQLRVRYGARNKALNVLHIQITSREFDFPEMIEGDTGEIK